MQPSLCLHVAVINYRKKYGPPKSIKVTDSDNLKNETRDDNKEHGENYNENKEIEEEREEEEEEEYEDAYCNLFSEE